MSDLLSVVVRVRAPQEMTMPSHVGRAVHALLLHWIGLTRPDLAEQWHNAEGVKPFAVSNLVGGKRIDKFTRVLAPQHDGWFRLVALNAEIAQTLQAVIDAPPADVDIDGNLLEVVELITDPQKHEWAGQTDYETLSAGYLLARAAPSRRVALELITPTLFRQNGLETPLPTADLVFGSLCDKWNAYSTVQIAPQFREYSRLGVMVTYFDLKSASVSHKNKVMLVGGVGSVTYTAVQYDRYWMSMLALLADFALYAGVGRHTTMGMGQARRVHIGHGAEA